jgi:hypothetical protein
MRTGNLATVTKTIGHHDVKTAMHYQPPGTGNRALRSITVHQQLKQRRSK